LEATTVEPSGALDPTAPGNKGLKSNALGYISNLVIAIASTAPAYSLAATLGFIVAVGGIGVHAPAVLIVSFIPILFVSVGYRFLNLADPDAGTTFAWVAKAFGPQLGWINGWAIFLADIIVMASLAAIASNYSFLLFRSAGAPSNFWLIVGAVVWIAVMTWICYRGIELSARIQTILLGLGRGPGQGLRQQPAPVDPRYGVVVQPLRPQLGGPGRRHPARDLHLLGVGLGCGGQ
jgi:amino acid transporter